MEIAQDYFHDNSRQRYMRILPQIREILSFDKFSEYSAEIQDAFIKEFSRQQPLSEYMSLNQKIRTFVSEDVYNKMPLDVKEFLQKASLPAERAITTKILNRNLKFNVDGEENEGLKKAVSEALETSTRELYFKRIALHLTAAISANLKKNNYGQGSITLACRMISTLSKRFESISSYELRKMCQTDQREASSIQKIVDSQEYSVQIAMELLKYHKYLYSEDDWDTLIECKGGIIQLMKE